MGQPRVLIPSLWLVVTNRGCRIMPVSRLDHFDKRNVEETIFSPLVKSKSW